MANIKPLSHMRLPEDDLRQDRKKCRKYDQCGLGEKAIFLGSGFTPRKYYVPYSAVTHVYKRVAVSKGSGRGILAPILYLVVRYDDGKEMQNSFRYLQDADKMMDDLEKNHPEIILMSPEGAKKAAQKAENEKRIADAVLAEEPGREVKKLEKAAETLEKRPSLYNNLAASARIKRRQDLVHKGYRAAALILFAAGGAAFAAGIVMLAMKTGGSAAVLVMLLGAALMLMMWNSRVMETPRHGRKAADREYEKALDDMERSLRGEKFPVPAALAHPTVLARMIWIIREGRAADTKTALETLSEDLMKINSDVALTGKDYTDAVTIKPLFMVYQSDPQNDATLRG